MPLILLVSAIITDEAFAVDLRLFLDYQAICTTGPCTDFAGGVRDPWGYFSPRFSTHEEARQRAIADYVKKSGWDVPQPNSGWRTYCGPSTVMDGTPFQYSPYNQTWSNAFYFRHVCYAYRPDGLSPPSAPYNSDRWITVEGFCEPGYYKYKDWNTGECGRNPNQCLQYADNNTFGCGKVVAELDSILKLSNDPTRVFHGALSCISRKSCDARCRMDNCKWLDYVIPHFNRPYIDKGGDWNRIEADCATPTLGNIGGPYGAFFRDAMCAQDMAMYHINVDLQNALNAHGCGSEADWNIVADIIAQCSTEFFSSVPPGMQSTSKIAMRRVIRERNKVRQQCMTGRTGASLPVDVNSGQGGKVCLAPN